MQDNTILIIVTGLLTFGGTVLTSILTVWRENEKSKLDEKHREADIQDRKDKAALDEKHREWDIQDRKEKADATAQARLDDAAAVALALKQQAAAIAQKVADEAAALAVKVKAASIALDVSSDKRVGVILGKLQENTDISTAAFDAANHVDEKLAGIHKRIDGVQDTGQQDRIEQTGNDTNATVHKIEKEG